MFDVVAESAAIEWVSPLSINWYPEYIRSPAQ
jgi:hypothetical protein